MGEIDADMFDRYSVDDYVKVIHGPLEGTEVAFLLSTAKQKWLSSKLFSLVVPPKLKSISLKLIKSKHY